MATTTSAVATSFLTNLAALGCCRVQGHPKLVAIHRQEHGTAALRPGADGDELAVFATTNPFDVDHLGTEIGQKCRTERAGNVTPEIEHANAFEDARQLPLLPLPPIRNLSGCRQSVSDWLS